jgi:5-methylcytosine-specific restriction endonuclease McrA
MKKLPKTPKEALLSKSTTYYTGKECKQGHLSVRFTQSRECQECARIRSDSRGLDPIVLSQLRAYSNEYNTKNKEVIKEYKRNKLSTDQEYRDAEKIRTREWARQNKWYFRSKWSADSAARRGAKLYTINLELTKNFCKECPKNLTIDHIIPVSKGGIHDISNLQYLEPSLNYSKRDKANIPVNGIFCLPCDPAIYPSKI